MFKYQIYAIDIRIFYKWQKNNIDELSAWQNNVGLVFQLSMLCYIRDFSSRTQYCSADPKGGNCLFSIKRLLPFDFVKHYITGRPT